MSKDKAAKIPTPQPVRGTQDMLGDVADRFAHVVETFERVRRLYGFKRIEVPVIEPTAVFARSLGETTDVVSKEMYSFDDRGGESVTLRPEFTAGIARAYITNGWQQFAPLKVATHGPLFRYERPQKGRYRQFHQLDAEVLGSDSPLADAELLVFADQLLKQLGIAEGVTLTLNTLGDAQSREAGARRWSSTSRHIVAICPKTVLRGSTRIRCGFWTAKTRATARLPTARPTSTHSSPARRKTSSVR